MPDSTPHPPPAAAPGGPPRPAVHLRVPAGRRHVSFFRKMVRRPDTQISPGALVDVHDRNGLLLGCGFYNPNSEIAIRLLGPAEEGIIERRLRAAIANRAALHLDAVADAWRVCHAEGDGLPGLIVDRYADVHSVELFSFGMFRQLDAIRRVLPNAFVRADTRSQELEGFRLADPPPPPPVTIREHGVRFAVDFARGHKTGFFCDQRENRRAVAELAGGADVLDLCCYSGGFAVSAAVAGARRVIGVDMDEEALETAAENARLNRVRVEFHHQNLFDFLRNTPDRFDIVVLDPPKLVRDKTELAKGRRSYYDMNRLAARVVKPGGVLVSCSCSGLVSEEEFLALMRDACERELRTFRVAGAGPDHPVSSLYPEGRYLKVAFSRVV
ncbi:MAG: class I SAM-dependent rRNA methyltransferase [Planctomycetes bacterium]|nr:class I SAM-dependent rRNA methyltransferase [Planctomycetota bacterium]